MPHAVVIGGGAGGLAVAIRLAAKDWQVTLLERNETLGGKIGQYEQGGYRWDTGPSILTMRPVVEELFQLAGSDLTQELDLVSLEPMVRCHYVDTDPLTIWSDLPRTLAEIEAIEPRDVDGYLRFLAYAARIYRLCLPSFIDSPPPTWRSLLVHPPLDLLRIDPLRTVHRAIKSHLRSPKLQWMLERFASYVGASPYHAPATLNVIAHAELAGSVWYPRGGFFQMATALERVARKLGVVIRPNAPVETISLKSGRAQGVRLAGGEEIHADVVVSNVDVTTTYERLIARDGPSPAEHAAAQYGQRLARRTPSASGLVFLWGIEGEHAEIVHHNMFFSSDYRREFREMVDERRPASSPSFYVAVTSKTDPSHAPAGGENWFVLVNVPPREPDANGNDDWSERLPEYRELVLHRLKQHGYDLTERIRVERVLTPYDFEKMTGAFRGSLFGTNANNPFSAFLRPRNRSPHVKGLYFVGGTTHPGAGVPMVMLSAKVTAQMIADDLRELAR